MMETKNESLPTALQAAWDSGKIHRHSTPEQIQELASAWLDIHGRTDLDSEWFARNTPWLKERLAKAKADRIEAAVKLLFDEVNGGDEHMLIDPIGRQHAYLLDRFAMTVIEAINEHKRHDVAPPTSDETSDVRIATRKLATEEWTEVTGLTADDLVDIVQDEVRMRRSSFDGRINRFLQHIVVRSFFQRRKRPENG